MKNALTINVEEYFQVPAFEPFIGRENWSKQESRVAENIDALLSWLAESRILATFFVLGWVAERHPGVVRQIADAGHEIGSLGYSRVRARDQTANGFQRDVRRSKDILEDILGSKVYGFRAPGFSIGSASLWAFDVLSELGFAYDSSIYPIYHDHYGMPESPRFPFKVESGLLEVPVATIRVGMRNLPMGGGGYFRLLPYAITRWAIKKINAEDRQYAVLYFGSWEFDGNQPRVPGIDNKTRFRHYVNLRKNEARFRRLLQEFTFGPIRDVVLTEHETQPGAAPVAH